MLGFQSYGPPYQRKGQKELPKSGPRIQGNHSNHYMHSNRQNNDFIYNPEEFPPPVRNNEVNQRNQILSPQINGESFLELLESVKSIQKNQGIFQQELMHLKMSIPLHQHLPGIFNPQPQAQNPVTNI